MELTLKRTTLTPEFTLGELFIDGAFFCYTVEDTVRTGEKIFGKTAIPYGHYKVILNMSNHFKKVMPLLLDVPQFEGVRIHSGNTANDSEGCIIIGLERTKDGVGVSRIAFTKLMERLKGQNIINISII
jgi:hypothetical protein